MPDNTELSKVDILPDCRAVSGRYVKSFKGIPGVSHVVPCYCANCGVHAGDVLDVESQTFIFVLCDPCGEKYGEEADKMLTPQGAFFAEASQEMHEKFGRDLTEPEIQKVVDSDTSPLSTLITKGR